jgi:hypothetical protein
MMGLVEPSGLTGMNCSGGDWPAVRAGEMHRLGWPGLLPHQRTRCLACRKGWVGEHLNDGQLASRL